MRTIPATARDLRAPRSPGGSPRVYLAGPRTCLDPVGHAALAEALLQLGLIVEPVETAFASAAAALRTLGADVTSPYEQRWWRGEEVGAEELRAGRAANAAAPAAADLVVVLDGWLDVPGAVDGPVIAARTAGVPVLVVSEALPVLRARAARHRRPAA